MIGISSSLFFFFPLLDNYKITLTYMILILFSYYKYLLKEAKGLR